MYNAELRMGMALLKFKQAYKELAAASRALPDLDVSENYPFYLLDYEVIEGKVVVWCNTHASKLLASLPDRIVNPACFACSDFNVALVSPGLCKACDAHGCANSPMIVYSKEAVTPLLKSRKISTDNMSDNDILCVYLQEVEKRRSE